MVAEAARHTLHSLDAAVDRFIHWMRLWIASARAFVARVVAAFITPSQCFLIMRATRLIDSNRDRTAHAYHFVQIRSAQPRRT